MAWRNSGLNYIAQKYGNSSQCIVSSGLVFDIIDATGLPQNGLTGGTADIVALILLGMIDANATGGITMVIPSRPKITNPNHALTTANVDGLSASDAALVSDYDETSASQWCYTAPLDCTNPTGANGVEFCGSESQYFVYKDHLYRCENGTWVDKGYNSSCVSSNDCANPTGANGSVGCVGGYEATCNNGTWERKDPAIECEACSLHKTEPLCTAAGCNWYAYPNPFGDPQCFSEPIYIKYLPFIAVGVGAVILIAALAGSRGRGGYSQQYYPPPRR